METVPLDRLRSMKPGKYIIHEEKSGGVGHAIPFILNNGNDVPVQTLIGDSVYHVDHGDFITAVTGNSQKIGIIMVKIGEYADDKNNCSHLDCIAGAHLGYCIRRKNCPSCGGPVHVDVQP